MGKNKIISVIVGIVIAVIVGIVILISTTTDSPKEKYYKDIASHLSAMETEFTVETNFKTKYTDATVPDILRASRHYDSASACLLTGITYKGTNSQNGKYITTFTVSYAMSKEDYNSLYYWIDQNIASQITATTDYAKAKEAHDYIIVNCTSGDGDSISAFLKDGQEGNMRAYAIAYKMILDCLGVESECVYDKGYYNNIVKVDGMWFGVNVYSDDTRSSSGYDYFLYDADSKSKPADGKLSPYKYNVENPSMTKTLFYIYYGILYIGWPLAIIALIIVLIKRKKS